MAYNKITSHFSSSETFSEDRYFSYDNTTNKAGFVNFIDFANSTNVSITGSGNNVYITGNLDLLNDLTSSRVIVNNSEIKFDNQSNYFAKRNNNSISINGNAEMTGSVEVNETNVLNGLTGSLINVDENNTKFLQKISGIEINIETEATTGLPRWRLTQTSQVGGIVGVTQVFLKFSPGYGDANESLILTGSTVVQHYNNIEKEDHPFANGQLRFSKFTNEHKELIGTGKYHIFIIHTKNIVGSRNGQSFRLYPTTGDNNTFDPVQIGAKYRVIIGDFNNQEMRKHNFNLHVPQTDRIVNIAGLENENIFPKALGSNSAVREDEALDRELPKVGVSFTIKCIDNNKWEIF